jgi:uncharacterized membrane protein
MSHRIHTVRQRLHVLFEAGVLIKAIDSVAEISLGILFLILSPQAVNRIVFFLFGDELTEQPRDALWNFLLHNFSGISAGTQHFWAVIFLAHGLAKILLVAGLVKKRLWIYPLAAATFGCFVIYQAYHLIYAPSLLLEVLTSLDVLFVFLIVREYDYQREKRSRAV